MSRVSIQQILDEIFTFDGNVFRTLVFTRKNLFLKFSSVGIFERQVPCYHCKQDNPTTPNVHLHSIILLASHHFRSCLTWTPTGGLQQFSWFLSIAQAKVYNLHILIVIQQKVLRFEVSVYYVQFVYLFYSM